MKKIHCIQLLAILFSIVIQSCEEPAPENEDLPNDTFASIDGYVQKGPFLNGTSISIYELNSSFEQTGKSFNTQIKDNSGKFEINSLSLESTFVELKADGYYFNEVSGETSVSRMTLYGISDLNNKTSLNVNILSHLEKPRIAYLLSENMDFHTAKSQAQKEVLNIFSFDKEDIKESELLDISKEGDDNAILLTISLILQGFRTDAEISELLANIITDITPDGELNDADLGSDLVNHAILLSSSEIRTNLKTRYETLNIDFQIPDFESYLQYFLDNTPYAATNIIVYPESGKFGPNILHESVTELKAKSNYSMAANLSKGCSIKIKLNGGVWHYQALPLGPVNWLPDAFSFETLQQTFTSIEKGVDCDLNILFSPPYVTSDTINGVVQNHISRDTIMVEYFENNSELPVLVKKLPVLK